MRMNHPAVAALVAGAAVALAGCGAATTASGPPPAKVIHIAGSQVQRLQLTPRAIHRLGITTEPVRQLRPAAGKARKSTPARKAVPYSAVVYDTDGSTWTYVNTSAGGYV